MRIVIAEDEPKSREGLINCIRRFTDYEIVGVANDGLEGFGIVMEQKPDLVISDIKMPKLDGLGMLERLKEEQIEVEAVLLTGYSEFEYAKKALELQVVDYVLKPLEIDQFLSVLKKVEGRIQKQKVYRLTPNQFLEIYMSGNDQERETILPVLEESLGVNDHVLSALILVRPQSSEKEIYDKIQEQMQRTLDALCMQNYYFIVRQNEDGGVFLLLVDIKHNRNLKTIFMSRVLPQLQKISRCVCSMMKMYGVRDIDCVMEKLVSLLQYSFSVPEGVIIDWETAQTISYEKLEYPTTLENKIVQYIRKGKKDRVLETGKEFAEHVIESSASPECIRNYTIRLLGEILKVAGEMQHSLNYEEESRHIMEVIHGSISRNELRCQFEETLKKLPVLVGDSEDFMTENGIVMNAILYIRQNYEKNIGLVEVAQFCNISPEYLSRIFKKEMGMKFVDFLTNFRISAAKRMLIQEDYQVKEVAKNVGFSDQKYFQRIFKKVCGVTPMEYKKQFGA